MQKILTATIPSGESLSSPVDISNLQPLAIETPSSWTAADITIQCSRDSLNWYDLFDRAGDEGVNKAGTSRHIPLDLPLLGAQYLRLRSGLSGAAVNQAAARDIYIIAMVVG